MDASGSFGRDLDSAQEITGCFGGWRQDVSLYHSCGHPVWLLWCRFSKSMEEVDVDLPPGWRRRNSFIVSLIRDSISLKL